MAKKEKFSFQMNLLFNWLNSFKWLFGNSKHF